MPATVKASRHLLLLAALALAPLTSQAEPAMLGYTPQAAARQSELERELQAMVAPDSISALHAPLSGRPHPAGSEGSREVVAILERNLRSYGLEVERHEYQAWLSRARSVQLTLTAPDARELTLVEPALDVDPDSTHPELGPGFIAYSASGDVTAPVVYANYGLPADYAELERQGVSVRDRIVLARYGRSHRAVKVFTAQQAGAKALVLYSDPADDGFVKGEPWPAGYWRGETMLQRGNAKLSWFFHGDPLTPGVAATADAERLDPVQAPTLPRIPVLAIGWAEARHVLAALGGPAAPSEFTGGIPIAYHLGPGPATLRVAVQMEDGLRPIHNVVATLRGATQPARMVMLGGHHDAWTFGGVDPGTGAAALLEVARVLGHAARQGQRPERSIRIAFWDAEEFGLVGSTEYAEQFRRELQQQLLLYVNTDMVLQGRFDPGGVPSLRDFVIDVTRSVPGSAGRTVFDHWISPHSAAPARAGDMPALKPLGSGADFVPFQDFLGVPTLSIEFIGANGYGFGTYHSNFDTRSYVTRVADPGFAYGAMLARTLSTLAVRMANAEVLPFRYSQYGNQLVEAVQKATASVQTLQPATPVAATAALLAHAEAVRNSAATLEAALEARLASGTLENIELPRLNDLLARTEQTLADDRGMPERAWYRHVFHGWNIYSLYDGQPFPGLADAVRSGDRARTDIELERIQDALVRMRETLDEARALVVAPALSTRTSANASASPRPGE
ncbi:MAG: M28 family peptidase [Gammaproteobacteria bacterium]